MRDKRITICNSMKDFVVIDIETKNTFFDVGRDNFDKLEVSFVGAYSYAQNKYFSFFENEMDEAEEFFKNAGLIVGFSINRFDVPVLKKHFDLFPVRRFDILDEIEMQLGRRISLNLLAKTNLGVQKTHHGLEAPILYKDGKFDELRDYCLNDVKITKELYDLAKKRGFLLVPIKGCDEFEKAFFNFAGTLFAVCFILFFVV